MKILSIVGARPQFIKLGPISRELCKNEDIEEIIIHTGQHYDDNMSEIFFKDLSLPSPNYNLNVGSGSHGIQTGEMIKRIEEVLIIENPDFVIVYGDTNSTLAGAIAAKKIYLPVAHIESGLRSYNKKMPEEINRIVTDSISDLLFAPTETAVQNLKKEGKEANTYFSGDIMLDSTMYYRDKFEETQVVKKSKESFLLTLHRAENTDNTARLVNIFKAIENIKKEIIFPIHPRTKAILKEKLTLPKNINVVEPMGYTDLLKQIMISEIVLTDSGGVQKEAYFLGKQCITLREETEWIETLEGNWNMLAGADIEKITEAIKVKPVNYPDYGKFGNGLASNKIVREIIKHAK